MISRHLYNEPTCQIHVNKLSFQQAQGGLLNYGLYKMQESAEPRQRPLPCDLFSYIIASFTFRQGVKTLQ